MHDSVGLSNHASCGHGACPRNNFHSFALVFVACPPLPTVSFQMSVITATSPNSPDSFVVATSHHQNMPRASASSPSTSVNGLHYSAPATPAGPRRLGTNDAGHGNSAAASMSNGRKSKRSILDLATEQLVDILNYLEDDPQKSIGFDRRAYLSQESFRPPIPPSTTRATDLAHFRETCKKFAEVVICL